MSFMKNIKPACDQKDIDDALSAVMSARDSLSAAMECAVTNAAGTDKMLTICRKLDQIAVAMHARIAEVEAQSSNGVE